jgi:hypothetical protein
MNRRAFFRGILAASVSAVAEPLVKAVPAAKDATPCNDKWLPANEMRHMNGTILFESVEGQPGIYQDHLDHRIKFTREEVAAFFGIPAHLIG